MSMYSNGYLEKLGFVNSLYELDNNNSLGNLKKWVGVLSNGTKVYIKSSSSIRGHFNYECEAECISCNLADLLGMKYVVHYKFDRLYLQKDSKRGIKVCVSTDFIGNGSFATVNSLVPCIPSYTGADKYNMLIKSFPGLRLQLDTILTFDAIILNSDRHLRNIGILNGSIIPLFDNGNSLFYDKTVDYISKVLKTSLDYQPCKPFYYTFGKQLDLVSKHYLKPVNKVQVYRVVNTYLDGSRAKLVNKMLVMRLERLGLLCR